MGSTLCVAEKGVAPMERPKEKGGGSDEQLRKGHTNNCKEIAFYESSPKSTHSLPPLCEPCHALSSFPEGLQTHTTSLQEQQSYTQLIQEKEYYRILCEETQVRNRKLVEWIEHHKEKKDHEVLRLQQHLCELERRCREENENVNVYREKCRDLSLKIERAEHLHSQQSMADSGSYQDSAATPPLLQIAADSVKDAITICASDLFSRIKKNSLPINLARMNLDSKETGQIVKFTLQSFLCHILFIGFENPFFFALDGLPPFEKPAKRKNHFLQVYKRCRDLDARQMLNDETDFAHFFGVKESGLCMQLKEQLLMTDDVQAKEDFIISELCSRNNNKFLRLGKAVWVLHKLAFAFEPSAEIFRVGQGSVLDEEFMEDVAGDDDEDEHDDEKMVDSPRSMKQVRFMCVPGFTVRHTIIRSRVFSLKESHRHICCHKQDPSAMTVD